MNEYTLFSPFFAITAFAARASYVSKFLINTVMTCLVSRASDLLETVFDRLIYRKMDRVIGNEL